ncbi:hypothetical protein B0H13DRAFT_1895425 [Mycena leptocephala]|nr:hypothetical protein B0H13DRAFT_1895425 [Mycena leptocephala]
MSQPIQNAPAPFSGDPDPENNVPAPDFIVRSGDDVDLHVHKAILQFVSVFFKNMLDGDGKFTSLHLLPWALAGTLFACCPEFGRKAALSTLKSPSAPRISCSPNWSSCRPWRFSNSTSSTMRAGKRRNKLSRAIPAPSIIPIPIARTTSISPRSKQMPGTPNLSGGNSGKMVTTVWNASQSYSQTIMVTGSTFGHRRGSSITSTCWHPS